MFGPAFSQFNLGSRRGLMVPSPIIPMTGSPVSSGVLVAEGVITDAQMKTILGTPVELIPAETGSMICIISIHVFCNVLVNGGVGLNVTGRYGAALQTAIPSFTALAAVNGLRQTMQAAQPFNILGATDLRGANINLIGTANAAAGYTSATGWNWRVTYFMLEGA